MGPQVAVRFAGVRQFELCLNGARMTPAGFDANGDLGVDEPNDPDAIAAVQGALRDLGYPQLVSLSYDDTTAANVRQFKIDQQLPVPPSLAEHDGVCGPGTSGRLNALFTPAPWPGPPPPPPPPPLALDDWQSLISFRPPALMQATLNERFGLFGPTRVVHAIEGARGRINLDHYPIRVSAMPSDGTSTMDGPQLLEFIRRNINDFVDGAPDGCNFQPYDAAIDTAAWLPPFLPTGFPGAAISIDMFSHGVNVDDGSVVLSEIANDHWIFSTLWTPDDGGHPVSGNREWRFVSGVAGELIFSTRGADRCTSIADDVASATVFGAADQLWRSFQRRFAAFVNSNGGAAAIETATSTRYDWGTVQAAYHRPTVPWVQ